MPTRVQPLPAPEVSAVLARIDAATASGSHPAGGDERAAVKHFLAVLATRHPGKSVEVRVPPYAAVQCIPGVRHTRGTPPAVVETDAATWLALARGQLAFAVALAAGRLRASGQRSDLSPYLPLLEDPPLAPPEHVGEPKQEHPLSEQPPVQPPPDGPPTE